MDHAEDMAKLREQIAASDRASARRMALTLKGAAGKLGATQVQRLAAELENAIQSDRDAAEIAPLADATEDAMRPLCASILAILQAEAHFSGEIDWATVHQVLDELGPQLAGSNMDANEIIDTHAPLPMQSLPPGTPWILTIWHAIAIKSRLLCNIR